MTVVTICVSCLKNPIVKEFNPYCSKGCRYDCAVKEEMSKSTSPHPFQNFKETVNSYQDSPNLQSPNDKYNRRCLQCQRQILSSRFSPYCSDVCMNNHDKGLVHTQPDSNLIGNFSEVFSQ